MTIQTSQRTNGLRYLERPYTVIERPLPWQVRGLTWTASGYGARIPSRYVVRTSDGRIRRVYVTQYSNAGTAWIIVGGQHVIVTDLDR